MKLILATKSDGWCDYAETLAKRAFDVSVIRNEGPWRDPGTAAWLTADVLISYRCPHIFPQAILDRYETAINFHPGSTNYPGRGYSHAIYEGAAEYGVVCHHMTAGVDSGPVIMERRFPIRADETLGSLFVRTQCELLALFAAVLDVLDAITP